MKKIKRRLEAIILTFVMVVSVFALNVNVQAEGLDELGQIVDGSLLTNEKEVSDTSQILTRGNLLNFGYASCVDAGGGQVTAGGTTVAHKTCDKLSISITLQKKVGGTWTNYKIWNASKTVASSFTKSYTVNVEGGYYYRVKGAHMAELGYKESTTTITDGIWIA